MIRYWSALLFLGIATPAEAAAPWRQIETPHFHIYSQGGDTELKRYAERLEGEHHLLGLVMAIPPSRAPVKVSVYFVDSVATVQRLSGRPGSDIAGYYEPDLSGAVAVVPRRASDDAFFSSQVVLFHEYAHHFMLQYQPAAYPAWLVEGFAELVSTASFERPGAITFGKAAQHRQNDLVYARWSPLPRLMTSTYDEGLTSDERNAFYGQSWLLTHYLVMSGKRPGQLSAFIAAINSGKSFENASRVFGNLTDLQRELRIYFEGGSFIYKAPALPADLIAGASPYPVPAGKAALIEERITLLHMNGTAKDDAVKAKRAGWLAAIEAKVAGMGSDPDALQLLADAECAAEKYDACGAAADRLLAIAPARPHAMLRKGDAMLGLAGHDPKAVGAARQWIVKANRAAPDDPEPLVAYYRSFGIAGKAAPDVAFDGLIQAMIAVPQVNDIRLSVADELIGHNRKDEARVVLKPLAFAPHPSSGQKAALALLDMMDGKPVEQPK